MKTTKCVFLIFIIASIFTIIQAKAPETNLSDAFLTTNAKSENIIAKLSKVSNDKINIIIETDNIDDNEEIKNEVQNIVSKNNNDLINDTINIYKKYPRNFLSDKTRKLLIEEKYDEIEKNSLELLYNPLSIFVADLQDDPFLFATDFVLAKNKNEDNLTEKDGKFYSLIRAKVKDNKDLRRIKKEVSNIEGAKIYFSGVPVHTIETQKRSNIEINVICILSTIMIVYFCRRCFRSHKIIFPIALSILFGFLFGYTFTALIFGRLHILTFVFSTSLIGISLDYALHFYSSGKEANFKKNLSTSLLSTVLTFGVLYFSNIKILEEIAVFVSFGLIGVYLFCLNALPLFNINADVIRIETSKIQKYKIPILLTVLIVIMTGFFRADFDDSINSLYKPKGELLKAEKIYSSVFNDKPAKFIIIKGKNIDDILKKEESLTEVLNNKNIKSISLSDFISSKRKQEENLELTQNFYNKKLNSYTKMLNLKPNKEKDALYDAEDFSLNKEFMLDNQTSFITIFTDDNILDSINPNDEMTKILKNFRNKCLGLIPIIFIALFVSIKFFYTTEKTLKIIIPPFLGGVIALCSVSIFENLNVFHLLAFILSLGFSMDYSIFRTGGSKNSNTAVLISCISTAFSFILLSFAGFKLISSLGVVLSIGIISSYILSLLLISDETENV